MSNPSQKPKPPGTRKDQVEAKLRAAIHRLAIGAPVHPANKRATRPFTVAALSREAGVARNAIYTSHRGCLEELRQLAAGGTASTKHGLKDTDRQALETRIRRLATDNAVLLKRALDAERRAERLERRCAALLKQRDNQLAVTRLPSA